MFLKVVRIFVVLVILFSYLPIARAEFCPNESHVDHVKLNCGYVFHCPFVSNNSFLESITILNIGRLVLIAALPLVEDLEYPIFHPPKASHESSFAS
jgi:hypothetical protein